LIRTGRTDDTKVEYISIDLATTKYKNRVLDLFAALDLLGENWKYEIRAKWTDSKFHPTMWMNEDDILKLSDALNRWANDIRARRSAAP
jgi:hypothetical protein